ncbi:MAG: hypothetical protein L3J82_05525 [Planctomycetes bacterium]|nr:hypothetical protein [Planctomycetota bacterium]
MSGTTNIYIDGEHAAAITDLQHDLPWHYGNITPGDAFKELMESLEEAELRTGQEGSVELVAGEDTVDRVSWGEDVDTSEMITKLTLAKYEEEGAWELEFTCEEDASPEEDAEDTAEDPAEPSEESSVA